MRGDSPTSEAEGPSGSSAPGPADRAPTLESTESTNLLAVVVALAAAAYFLGLGSHGLLDNNEGIYAGIPREMIERGDWITPHWNGVMYLEKPPLLYWLIALSYRAFGVAEASARLVPAAAAVGSAAALYAWLRRVSSPRHGLLAALLFLTSIGAVALGRTVLFDMLLTFWITSSLACLHLALGTGRRRWAALAGVALACGVLTKGLVALVLPAAVVLAWLVVARDLGGLRRLRLPTIALVFVAVAAPWHVAASLRTKEFADFYFINEHWNRFLGRREPADFRSGRIWYYVPLVGLLAFPWTFLLPASFVSGWKALRGAARAPRPWMPPPDAFAFLAVVVPVTFFSLSTAKATYYTIVASPAGAALGASTLLALVAPDRGPRTRAIWNLPALLQFAAVAVAAFVLQVRSGEVGDAWPFVVAIGGACVLFHAALLVPRLRRPLPIAAAACCYLGTVVAAWSRVGQELEPELSSRPMAAAILANAHADEPVVVKGRLERASGLPFYLRRRVVEYDGGDGDLEWGKRWEGGSDYFVPRKALRTWRRTRPTWLVVGDEDALPWITGTLRDARAERIWSAPTRDGGYHAVWRISNH